MANHHVMRSQPIAPASAPAITASLTTCGSMIPSPMVRATCNGKIKNAMKLKNAVVQARNQIVGVQAVARALGFCRVGIAASPADAPAQ